LPATSNATWALLFIGLCPSVISSALWNRALTTIPPARAGVFLNLITVFTVLISVALGKSFTAAEADWRRGRARGVAMTNAQAFRGGRAQSDAPHVSLNHRLPRTYLVQGHTVITHA